MSVLKLNSYLLRGRQQCQQYLSHSGYKLHKYLVDLRIEDLTKQFYIELAAREDIIANLIETASNFTERLGNSQDRIETKSEERYLRKEVPGLVLAAIIEANSKFDQTEDHATTSYGGTSASSISAMASTEAGFSGTFMTGIETTSSGGTKSSGATTVSD